MYLVEATPEEIIRIDPIRPISWLIEKGARVDIRDNEGKTAIDYAKNEKVQELRINTSIVLI